MITVRIMKSNCFEIHLNTLDNSLTTAASRSFNVFFYCNCFSQRNLRSVLKLQEVTGERREALVNLLVLQSAQLFDGWVVKQVYGK